MHSKITTWKKSVEFTRVSWNSMQLLPLDGHLQGSVGVTSLGWPFLPYIIHSFVSQSVNQILLNYPNPGLKNCKNLHLFFFLMNSECCFDNGKYRVMSLVTV